MALFSFLSIKMVTFAFLFLIMAGIYVHIPFCVSRCIYCDFYSTTYGREVMERYVDAVCNELTLRRDYVEGETVSTVYLGGGTPSLLSSEMLSRLFARIDSEYSLDANAEITIEANPDDLNAELVCSLPSMGVNRISIGVQTFDDEKLRILRRRHTGEQAVRAVEQCYNGGIKNISIDLIYGLPAQTLDMWEEDLKRAFSLPISHLSAYSLMYEEGTALWKLRKQHQVCEADDGLSLEMYEMLMNYASKNGMEHYEISNFALPRMASRHNSSYWNGSLYLGCGPSAHSYNRKTRRWNTSDLKAYIEANGDVEQKNLTLGEILDDATLFNDLIITSLRTSAGLSLTSLKEKFGMKYFDYLMRCAKSHIDAGCMELNDGNDTLRITRAGIFISDDIMSDLLWVE